MVIFLSLRDKEMNEKFLKRLEEDQEREMRQLEEKIRREVSLVLLCYFRRDALLFRHLGTPKIQY